MVIMGMVKEKVVIEINGEIKHEVDSMTFAYPYLLGLVEGASAYAWIKLELVKEDPLTYKLMEKRKGQITEDIIIIRKVREADKNVC